MTGLLGGFTTYSAFSLDALKLYESGQPIAALTYVGATVMLCLLAVAYADDQPKLRGADVERPAVQTRIVGGAQAAFNSHPSYVQWSHGCGGICELRNV